MAERKQKVAMAVTNDLVTDQRVHKVCMSLIEDGYEVVLIGRKLSYSQQLPDLVYQTKRLRLLFTRGMLFYACFNLRLFLKLLFIKADIFTANDLDTLPAIFLAGKIRRKKIVYDSHELFTEVPELEGNIFAKKVWTKLEEIIFPRLHNVSTVCQSISDIYSKKYNVPVSVVRNVPVKKEKVHTSVPENWKGKRVVLYQGAVNTGRGLELMIDAVRLMENTIFVIIGGGDIVPQLEKTIQQKNLSDKVILTGRMHYSELYAYTCMASCGISIEEAVGKNYYYALPNKIFDYIHAEIPFIVSDLPEMRRIAEEYKIGAILTERTAENLAKKITELCNEKTDSERYNRAKQELVWHKEKEKLLALYK